MNYAEERARMVDRDIRSRGIDDPEILKAMREVPREAFVPEEHREMAFRDGPLPIGEGQTISQPYIVALMANQLDLDENSRVLEVGAGSGYAAAVLAHIADEVYGIERHEPLAERARQTLEEIGVDNVTIVHGDGTKGMPEAAPFDAILVSAGGSDIPKALTDQLAPDGRLIMPVGGQLAQELVVVEKSKDGELKQRSLGGARFVPLVAG